MTNIQIAYTFDRLLTLCITKTRLKRANIKSLFCPAHGDEVSQVRSIVWPILPLKLYASVHALHHTSYEWVSTLTARPIHRVCLALQHIACNSNYAKLKHIHTLPYLFIRAYTVHAANGLDPRAFSPHPSHKNRLAATHAV